MPLPSPNLDDRKFQDILDEARRLIPRYCPEWTDHNLSDPGITLLELFAWMTDLLLYRLNRVPEKSYIKFLDLIGLRLETARPATADITFRLATAQPDDVVVPRGTPVGTVQTEEAPSITFTTNRELRIRVPVLTHVLTWRESSQRFHDYQQAMADHQSGSELPDLFGDPPRAGDALYLGFANDLGGHVLSVTFTLGITGIGVNPDDPPLIWECFDGQLHEWVPAVLEKDDTAGLNLDQGAVVIRLPKGSVPTGINGEVAFWVRCRVTPLSPGQRPYVTSPRVNALRVVTLGALIDASHAYKIVGEMLGASDGTPGQTFHLRTTPVLPRMEDETLEVMNDDKQFVPWTAVEHFGASGPNDPHYLFDEISGTIELGPVIRSPNGLERQLGRVPLAGRELRFSSYRCGGGVAGNVGAGRLYLLKSSIPFVESVTNYAPAVGGRDPESLEHARMRAPQLLRARERAVTPDDFEELARLASPEVARARCLMTGGVASAPSGQVRLVLVPDVSTVVTHLSREHLSVSSDAQGEVRAYLDDRRLLTTELVLEPPDYVGVRIEAEVRTFAQADPTRVAVEAEQALYRYLHPNIGGPDRSGWPFGRELFIAEIYALLQHLDDVDVVERVTMYDVDQETGATSTAAVRIALKPNELFRSYQHVVRATAGTTMRASRYG